MILTINDGLRLELTAVKHANGLYEAVDNNRRHLSEFLPWVGQMKSVGDFYNYIKDCESLYQQGKEVSFVIISDEVAVGRIGLHHLDQLNRIGAIGYWLTEDAVGKGIITQSCIKLISYGFEELNLNRIEIKAATGNLRSQTIPEKLNFKKEGILRQAGLVNDEFLDLNLYVMLKEEWV